jgi:hypothetical protein
MLYQIVYSEGDLKTIISQSPISFLQAIKEAKRLNSTMVKGSFLTEPLKGTAGQC